MPDPEIKIKVTADTAEAAAALQETQQQINQIEKNTQGETDSAAPIKELTAALQSLISELKRLATAREASDSAARKEAQQSELAAAQAQLEAASKRQLAAELKSISAARETTAATAGKEAQQSELAAAQAQLEAMSKRQLIEELKRLAAARRAAAASGDAEAYRAATGQYAQARKALRTLNQEQQIARMSSLQQAQAGMQLAQGIASLAQQAKSGQIDIASMTAQVMQLGLVIKSGLGPIGVLMAAIQGLTLAWDYWQGDKENKRKKDIEETQAAIERMQKAWKTAEEAAEASRAAYFESVRSSQEALHKALAEQRQTAQDDAKKADRDAQLQAKKELEAARSKFELEKAALELKKAQGAISDADAKQQIAALESQLNAAQEKASEDLAARELTAAQDRLDLVKSELKALELNAHAEFSHENFQKLLSFNLPSAAEMDAIKKQLADVGDEEETAHARSVNKVFSKTIVEARKLMSALGMNAEGTQDQIAAYVREVQALYAETQKNIDAKQREVKLEEENLDYIRQKVAADKEAAQNAEKSAKAAQAVKDAQEEVARLVSDYAAIEKDNHTARAAFLASALQSVQKGSAEYERWAKEAHQLTQDRALASLKGIESAFRTTEHYAVQDTRTEAQKIAANRKNLALRQQALRRLLAEPGLDSDTQKQINALLQATREEIKGFKQAMSLSRVAALDSLKNAKAPELTASNARDKALLKRLSKAYELQAAKMEAAARKGDDKALQRAQDNLLRVTRSMEHITGDRGKALHAANEKIAAAAKIRESTTDENRGKSAEKLRREAIDRQTRTSSQLSAAQKQHAAEHTRAAADLKKNKQAARPSQTNQQPSAPSTAAPLSQLAPLQQSLSASNASLEQISQALSQLAPMVAEMSNIAAVAAQKASDGISSIRQSLSNLKETVNRMRNR